uniref:Pco090977 n=1 Tax=Arundo donax TaxID=35708 RepID=A0A0A9D3J0_ARUDO
MPSLNVFGACFLKQQRNEHARQQKWPFSCRGNILFKGQIKVADIRKPSAEHSDDVFFFNTKDS